VTLRTLLVLLPNALAGVALALTAAAQPVQQEVVGGTLSGEVVSTDTRAGSLTVRSASGQTAVFDVDADTTIASGDEEIALSGLSVGDRVAVDSDRKGGQPHATYVVIVENVGKASAPPEATAGGAKVEVGHNRLSPATVQVGAGQTVTFHNVDAMPGGHTVVADDGSFSSPPLAKDQSWSHSFDVPGVYGVHIEEHPGTKASIVVE
jgi:plastocyanin